MISDLKIPWNGGRFGIILMDFKSSANSDILHIICRLKIHSLG